MLLNPVRVAGDVPSALDSALGCCGRDSRALSLIGSITSAGGRQAQLISQSSCSVGHIPSIIKAQEPSKVLLVAQVLTQTALQIPLQLNKLAVKPSVTPVHNSCMKQAMRYSPALTTTTPHA